MPVSTKVRTELERALPKLHPQPSTAQLSITVEYDDARRRFKLRVTELIRPFPNKSIIKATTFKEGEGPYYLRVWANNGRPYIRPLLGRELMDVFLLPS